MAVITITVPVTAETAELVNKILSSVKVDGADKAPTAETKPAKRGRKPKEEKVSEDDLEEDSENLLDEDELDEEADEEESEDEEADEDELDEEADDEDDKISPEQLVKLRKALRAYTSENGREKAGKVLKKFAKASQDVKAADFKKVITALKV